MKTVAIVGAAVVLVTLAATGSAAAVSSGQCEGDGRIVTRMHDGHAWCIGGFYNDMEVLFS
ncbi:hypothetical protein [Nocardia camponoti]|uniref:Secreted protein n=1 Tax=Nocardia camponoti TaxID=1616106 RepID=A0A917V6J3_9NOCA|nr:hypothetical protein [Nocardia camponoti]GGK43344.1 hypothetical protein GCM10011591_13740 [Nocardia camponoti]